MTFQALRSAATTRHYLWNWESKGQHGETPSEEIQANPRMPQNPVLSTVAVVSFENQGTVPATMHSTDPASSP